MDYKLLLIRLITSLFLIFVLTISFLQSIYLIVLFVMIIYAIIFYEIKSFFIYKNLLVYFYILSSFLIVEVYLLFYLNIIFIFNYILIVVLFDSYSYIFGTFFGKSKIFPSISPNKTYEGLLFGYIITLISVFTINIYTGSFADIITFLIVSTTIMVLAFIGDSFQSFLKRKSNIKNSSNWLPGHGGFFDRFDGFILSSFILPFVYMI